MMAMELILTLTLFLANILQTNANHGFPLPIVQKLLGHRSLKTTSIFLLPSTEKMAEAYDRE